MITVNLLPWRDEQREWQQRQFIALLVIAAVLGLAVVFLLHWINGRSLRRHQHRSEFIQHKLNDVNKELESLRDIKNKQAQLFSRIMLLQNLQQNRYQVVRLFNILPSLLPKGVYLSHIEHTHKAVILEGRAVSNQKITRLMANLNRQPFVRDPKLGEIKEMPNGKGFVVTFIPRGVKHS